MGSAGYIYTPTYVTHTIKEKEMNNLRVRDMRGSREGTWQKLE